MAERTGLRQAARTWRMLVIGAMALLVAACQTIVPRTEAPQTTAPVDTGVVTPGLPVDTERHRVALLVPQTGPDAPVGISIANATTLALLDSRSDRVRIDRKSVV